MESSVSSPASQGHWTSLWVVALLSLLAQLWLCQFFTFGQNVPVSVDMNPSNLWKFAYHFPPSGTFLVLNWLGVPYLPVALNPLGLGASLPPWLFFTAYAPVMATLALLAMAAFLRELGCPRPAALFASVIYAWQGDILPFVFPAHFGYITTWPFYALAAWGALRALRTRQWAYAIISGVCCGTMVQLQPDRGAIACLLIAALYIAPALFQIKTLNITPHRRIFFTCMLTVIAVGLLLQNPYIYFSGIVGLFIGLLITFIVLTEIRYLTLCAGMALFVSLASFMALFQSNIVGVKLGGDSSRERTYDLVTQFSMGPAEAITYLAPGFFGWHSNHMEAPYWGVVGQSINWPKNPNATRNFNYGISTTGTIATLLAFVGIFLLLPGRLLGPSPLSDRQNFFGRTLLILGSITLVLAWGWHTPLYRPLSYLPLMDKWRDPLKWLEMTNFAMITLSALGAQYVLTTLDADAAETKVRRNRISWFCCTVFVLLSVGLLISYPYTTFFLPIELRAANYDAGAITHIQGMIHFSLLVALALVALFYSLLFALWNPDKLRNLTLENPWIKSIWQKMLTAEHLPLTLAMGLSLLAVAQLAWVTSQFVQPVSLRFVTQTNPLLEELSSESNQTRVSVWTQDPLLNGLLLNQFNSAHISCIDISAASRIPDDINNFFRVFETHQGKMWFLTGVKNVVVPQQYIPQLQTDPEISTNIAHADGYTLEATMSDKLPSHALVVMKDYMAKATFVPRWKPTQKRKF